MTRYVYRRTGPRLDFYTLWAWMEASLGRPIPYFSHLTIFLPVSARHSYVWRRDGIRLHTAKRIATHFGVHPAEIWGPDWAKGTNLT